MKTRFKKKPLVFATIFLLLSGVGSFLIYQQTIKNNEQALEKEIELSTLANKQDEIKILNNYIKSIEKEKTLFETHFVQISDVVPFLNNLEKTAESVNTSLLVNSIDLAKDNSGLLVEIKNTGSFAQVYKFITLLENAPYEIEFLSVDMRTVVDEAKKTTPKKWEAVIGLKLISFT